MLRMVVGNDTGRAWNGFSFEIFETQIDYPNITTMQRGSLLRPDRAHMQPDKILPDRLGFEVLDIEQSFYTGRPPNEVLQTRHPSLDGAQGVETLDLFSGLYGSLRTARRSANSGSSFGRARWSVAGVP